LPLVAGIVFLGCCIAIASRTIATPGITQAVATFNFNHRHAFNVSRTNSGKAAAPLAFAVAAKIPEASSVGAA
jgi:hypothetical protein